MHQDMFAIMRHLNLRWSSPCDSLHKMIDTIENLPLFTPVVIRALNFGKPVNQTTTAKIRELFGFLAYLPKCRDKLHIWKE